MLKLKWYRIILLFAVFTTVQLKGYGIDLEEPSWYYKSLGDRKYIEGNYPEAIVYYKKSIIKRIKELESDKETANLKLKGYPEANIALARIYIKEKLYDMAMIHLNRAAELKHLLQIKDEIFEIFYLKAKVYRLKGDLKREIGIYKYIINQDPNWDIRRNYNPGIFKSLIYLRNDNISRLKFGKSYFELGEIYLKNKNYITAEPYFSMAFLYGYKIELAFKYLKECYEKLNKDYLIKTLKGLM